MNIIIPIGEFNQSFKNNGGLEFVFDKILCNRTLRVNTL